MKVMIVDDSPMIHKLLKKEIEKNGHQVVFIASNGKEAVENYMNLKPDLVFMDLTMPVMEGDQAYKEINKIDSNCKVVFLTALGDNKELFENDKNIIRIIKKPFKPDEIKEILMVVGAMS